jgi:hypothetical protein
MYQFKKFLRHFVETEVKALGSLSLKNMRTLDPGGNGAILNVGERRGTWPAKGEGKRTVGIRQ